MPTLGLRGVGQWDSDTRPKNYRQVILFLMPNSKSPLVALLSMLKDQVTTDPEFKIFTKDIPLQITNLAEDLDNSETVISVTTGDGALFKPGHVFINSATLEVFQVVSISGDDVTVGTRGSFGTAASAGVTATDELMIIGSHHAEGAAVPSAVSYDPVVINNYTQIFRNSINLTGSAANTTLRWGKPKVELKREALEVHGMEIDKAFLFGGKIEVSGTTNAADRTTKGLTNFVTTNVTNFSSTGVSIDNWENFMRDVFINGSDEKLFLAGAQAINVANKLGRAFHHIEVTPKDETYGMRMVTWQTPFGTLQIKQHPLLSRSSIFKSWGFVIDPKYIVYRYLDGRDTQYLTNRQNPGDDAIKEEYLTDCGLEVQFEKTHGIAKNMNAFVA
jgi:hypothetical protein